MAEQAENPRAVAGDNSALKVGDLKALADRVSHLMDERQKIRDQAKTYTADIGDVFAEAKSRGYDAPTLRKAIALRRLDKEARDTLGLYVEALGIFG